MQAEKISGAEFARRLGITRQAVSKARREGRLKVAGKDYRGRPLYAWPDKGFVVDLGQVDKVDDRGGRPPGKRPSPAPAAGLRFPLPPAVFVDGISGDWLCREDAETCFHGIGLSIDAGILSPCGSFPGGQLAFSFEEAAHLAQTLIFD